jgi:hypothetical protein
VSTGPHLHFELRQKTANGFIPVDPYTFWVTEETVIQPGPEEGMDVWITSYYDWGDDYGVDDLRLRVGGWGDYYYSLLKFDIDSLPSNVISAKIYLYTYGNDSGSNVSMYIDRITDTWDEDTGWYSAPSYVNLTTLPTPTLGAWYEIDITNLYNGWKDNIFENYGIQLRPTSVSHQFNEFYSSDYLDDPSLRPKLIVVP